MSKTLLLADDSLTIQRVVDLTFAQEDVRVVSFGNGEQAVKWMEGERPDIVLADVGMPQPDGYAVAQHMKQTARLRGVPVLLLTGAFEPLDDLRARESACDGVLVKPFEPQHLVARVVELLARPAVEIEEPEPAPAREAAGAPEVVETASVASSAFADPAVATAAAAHARVEAAVETPVTLHLVEPPATSPAHDSVDTQTFSSDMAGLDSALEWVDASGHESVDPVVPAQSLQTDEPLDIEWGVPLTTPQEPIAESAAPETVLEPLMPLKMLTTEAWDLAAPSVLEPPAELIPVPEPIASPAASVPERAHPPAPPAASPLAPMPAVSLASAFAALLAAEQTHPGGANASGSGVMTEAAIEDIVRRVLTRVTDEMVRQVVLDAAERLVKAEIDKIKDSDDDQN